jgi:diadenosine tetraphosphate (Ap4A) HIT family hydrolase
VWKQVKEMEKCPFCWPEVRQEAVMISEHHVFIRHPDQVLQGSGMIVPKQHKQTVFDLSEEEWLDTFALLKEVKKMLDETLSPDGYNVGWNCYPVAGQTVEHVHLHVIPRFQDEPLAGKGIRHHLKQKENLRASLRTNGLDHA